MNDDAGPAILDIDKIANWRISVNGCDIDTRGGSDIALAIIQSHKWPKNGVILMVENYIKWYQFYLIKFQDYKLTHYGDLLFQDIEKFSGAAWMAETGRHILSNDGHCVDPDAVENFCSFHNIVIPDYVSLMIEGMWCQLQH